MSDISVICFTDLKDSTGLTERLGADGFRTIRKEHLAVGEILAQGVGGQYVKSIGDAHMIKFTKIEAAFQFATQLQQYYMPKPCYDCPPIEVRIGLYLGISEPSGNDVFGSGVNRAARVEGVTPPGEVWLNKELVNAMSQIWGAKVAHRYMESCGEFILKGIEDPPKHELYSFDWLSFGKDNPKDGLSQLVFDHLEEASVLPSNLLMSDIATPATIIWPVVPRDLVNAIHRGQIEIIRLLTLLGWKVNVLIADCGTRNQVPREYSEKFKSALENHMKFRRIKDGQYLFMSDLYRPKTDCCHTIHEYFQKVITDITFKDLLDINLKDYPEDEREKVNKAPTLDFLQPALTIAAVLRISNDLEGKCAVVVGYDEKKQWVRAHDVPGSRSQIGVFFNPILHSKEGRQVKQRKNWPHWDSVHAMVDEMGSTNLAQWTAQLHVYLPAFPAKEIEISGSKINAEILEDEEKLDLAIKRDVLAKEVFEKLLST